MRLNRLVNGDGEVVGYFSDHLAETAARAEWNTWYGSCGGTGRPLRCSSTVVAVVAAELEDVDKGDGDRVDYVYMDGHGFHRAGLPTSCADRVVDWSRQGAAAVEVQRHLVNKYRRPGGSLREADLGGPQQAMGVLYVLRVRAPQ